MFKNLLTLTHILGKTSFEGRELKLGVLLESSIKLCNLIDYFGFHTEKCLM